jgi:septation ring formation regulator EzrA
MERTAWTDQRLDERFDRVDQRFDQVDKRFDRVEHDIRDVRGEVADLRIEMRDGFVEVRHEIDGLRSLMLRMNAAIIATVVATALLHGI